MHGAVLVLHEACMKARPYLHLDPGGQSTSYLVMTVIFFFFFECAAITVVVHEDISDLGYD